MGPSSHNKMQRHAANRDLLPQREFSDEAERNARRLRRENARRAAAAQARRLGS